MFEPRGDFFQRRRHLERMRAALQHARPGDQRQRQTVAETRFADLLATIFGIGAALVLDEFALIFYLKDVYWSEQGRTSVDAVFVAIAVTGLRAARFPPAGAPRRGRLPGGREYLGPICHRVCRCLINFGIAAVVMLKGKIWTALLGLFVFPLLIVGAIRLSRPGAPWARWRYTEQPKRMDRARSNANESGAGP